VRDYARAISLDSDEVVNEFCRLFPIGDRRSSRLIQAQAQLIGHQLAYAEPGSVPAEGDRRAAARTTVDDRSGMRVRIIGRSTATAIDAVCTLGLAFGVSSLMDISFWAIAGVITVMYYTVMTIAIGTSPGLKVMNTLRQRMPFLVGIVNRRRAHA